MAPRNSRALLLRGGEGNTLSLHHGRSTRQPQPPASSRQATRTPHPLDGNDGSALGGAGGATAASSSSSEDEDEMRVEVSCEEEEDWEPDPGGVAAALAHRRSVAVRERAAQAAALTCPACSRTFSIKSGLKYHVRNKVCIRRAKKSTTAPHPIRRFCQTHNLMHSGRGRGFCKRCSMETAKAKAQAKRVRRAKPAAAKTATAAGKKRKVSAAASGKGPRK